MSDIGDGTASAGAEELREEAIKSLKRKRKFAEDVVGYLTVNGVLWLVWALTGHPGGDPIPWPAWVSAIWGFFLLMDAWKTYGPWPRSLHQPITEAEIEREMRRARRA
jgi:hypothetical protein